MLKIIKAFLSLIFTAFSKLRVGSVKGTIKVNFYSRFTSNTHIGNNCHFNGLVIRGKGKVTIGDNFHSGKEILFINSYHKYDDANALPYDTVEMVDKEIVIGGNVWIGDRVTILGGVHIGEGAIIQAGAVVVNDIPDCAIAGGNPAKVFKYRLVDDYNKLLEEKRFC